MNLIIKIDDEMVCNDIKNKALEPTSETDKVIVNALYNGIPYDEAESMRDITPKEAIEYLLFMKHNVKEHSKQDKALDLAIKVLEARPQGEWIKIDEEWYDYKCSVCGEKVRRLYPFCHCGAKMKGGTDDE